MKTVYKYIKFEEGLGGNWLCLNKRAGHTLGEIEHNEGWNQYVIVFNAMCIFNDQCLKDIADFLGQLNKEEP